MSSLSETLILNTGHVMPRIGLGMWKISSQDVAQVIPTAIHDGYRHLDCAAIYQNERKIGEALAGVFQQGSVKREDLFITSKLWNTRHAPDDVAAACKQTLQDLRVESLDLYLMHWGIAFLPDTAEATRNASGGAVDAQGHLRLARTSIRETWEAMEEMVHVGLVRAIGVSNFTGAMLLDLLTYAKAAPAMNQIELHPYLQQQSLVDFCHRQGIAVTGYSPLGRATQEGRSNGVISDPVIVSIAAAHQKTPVQIVLRWAIQRGTVAIPKSTSPERLMENISLFDFELTDEDMGRIAALDRNTRIVNVPSSWNIPYFE